MTITKCDHCGKIMQSNYYTLSVRHTWNHTELERDDQLCEKCMDIITAAILGAK